MTPSNPKISVIIPVLNNREELRSTLQVLHEQTYPKELLEVIVVDNGSDEPLEPLSELFSFVLVKETGNRSPYAARNRGLKAATGSLIAMTDANKTPVRQWIEEGVKTLQSENADLVGGNITFQLPVNHTASERFDSLYFNNNRNLVLNEQASVTGNLFFKKSLIDELGEFPGSFRSGMDIWWSQRAVRKGFKLAFSESAVVICTPRRFFGLMKKSFRVGIAHPMIFRGYGYSNARIADQILRTFFPPKFRWMKEKGLTGESLWFRLKIWFVAWAYKILLGLGRIKGVRSLRDVG
ncbi:MAG: glycosyltransferase [Balneolaceae bacterium]|nr:MAG: glycosyltransferase [Balneolaceae bacterium]